MISTVGSIPLSRSIVFAMIVLSVLAVSVAADNDRLSIEVNDVEGKPIPHFDVNVVHQQRWSGWNRGVGGKLPLSDRIRTTAFDSYPEPIELFVRADGYAPTFVPVRFYSERAVEETILLQTGREARLKLHPPTGRALDHGIEPIVYLGRHAKIIRAARYRGLKNAPREASEFYPTSVRNHGDDSYSFRMQDDTPDFFIYIDREGYLRNYETGPYSSEDLANGVIDLHLPEPASLEVMFETDSAGGANDGPPDSEVSVTLSRRLRGKANSTEPLESARMPGGSIRQLWDDLPPGEYRVDIDASIDEESADKAPPGYRPYRDTRAFNLASGDSKSIHLEFVPFSEEFYTGDHAATIELGRLEASRSTPLPFRLSYSDVHYGEIVREEGVVPNDGVLHFEGLTANMRQARLDYSDFKSEDHRHSQYLLEVDDGRLGRFFFGIDGPGKTHEFAFDVAPDVGQMAPDIQLTEIFAESNLRLSGLFGPPTLLEFWATWSGPSQQPMSRKAEIMRNQDGKSSGRANIVAVSLDDDLYTVQKHVRDRAWAMVPHYWAGFGHSRGIGSEAAKAYGISGVPTALLIDGNGVIRWRGNPTDMSVEDELDKLLSAGADTNR